MVFDTLAATEGQIHENVSDNGDDLRDVHVLEVLRRESSKTQHVQDIFVVLDRVR